MTSATERDLATFVAATKAADEQDAQLLIVVVRKLREDDDLRYEHCATALEAMASRMTERIRSAQRWDEAGMLEDTDVTLPLDLFRDIELEVDRAAGSDKPNGDPPTSTGRGGR